MARSKALAFGVAFPMLALVSGFQIFNCTFGFVSKRLSIGSGCEPWAIEAMYRCVFHPGTLLMQLGLIAISVWVWRTTKLSARIALTPAFIMLIAVMLLVLGTDAGCYNSLIEKGVVEPTPWLLSIVRSALHGLSIMALPMFVMSVIFAIPVAFTVWRAPSA